MAASWAEKTVDWMVSHSVDHTVLQKAVTTAGRRVDDWVVSWVGKRVRCLAGRLAGLKAALWVVTMALKMAVPKEIWKVETLVVLMAFALVVQMVA